jgi:nucleoside 2-deoxyribosyltransferase
LAVTFSATVVRVFLASPSDTEHERETARTAIARWNVEHAPDEKVVLLPVGWETDSVPEWGDHPQLIVNRQLLDACDVLVGIFWTRLGTPTPDGESGTVEEIERFAASAKPVLLYFCRKNADLAAIDTEQLNAVRKFEAACRDRVLYDSYGDTGEFEAKLARALTRVVRNRFASERVGGEGMPRGRRLAEPPRPKQEARLAAHLENHGRHSYRLVVANAGTVDILGVNVEVPDEARSFSLLTDDLPLDVLRPGERVALMASVHMGGGKSIFDVHLTGETPGGDAVRCPSKISI